MERGKFETENFTSCILYDFTYPIYYHMRIHFDGKNVPIVDISVIVGGNPIPLLGQSAGAVKYTEYISKDR